MKTATKHVPIVNEPSEQMMKNLYMLLARNQAKVEAKIQKRLEEKEKGA